MFDKPFHNHPLIIADSLGSTFYFILTILIFNLPELYRAFKKIMVVGELPTSFSSFGISLFFSALLILFINVYRGWRIYEKQSYLLTETTFIITDERLHQSTLTLYRKDISNVTLSQNILQRLLGLHRIQIDTNTRDTADKTDITIVQKTAFARALKEELQRNIDVSPIASDSLEQTDKNKPSSYKSLTITTPSWQTNSNHDIFMHVFMNLSWLSLFLSGLVFMWALIAFILIFFFDTNLDWTPFSQEDLNSAWTALIPLIGFLAPLLSSIIGTYLKCYGFRIRRNDDYIELQQGLITRRNYNIPVQKIHAIILEQRVFARLFGYASVKAINIGFGNEKNEEAQLLLTTPLTKIEPTLKTLLPEFSNLPVLTPQPKQALLPILVPRLLFACIVILPALYYLPGYWKTLTMPLILLFPVYIYAACITPRLAISDERIAFTSGIFDSTTILLPTRHIEQMSISEPLLARPMNLSTATISILSGSILDATHTSGYFPHSVWQPLIEEITTFAQAEKISTINKK